jgi:hypothetical protein
MSRQAMWEAMPLDFHDQSIVPAGFHQGILMLHCDNGAVPHIVENQFFYEILRKAEAITSYRSYPSKQSRLHFSL